MLIGLCLYVITCAILFAQYTFKFYFSISLSNSDFFFQLPMAHTQKTLLPIRVDSQWEKPRLSINNSPTPLYFNTFTLC